MTGNYMFLQIAPFNTLPWFFSVPFCEERTSLDRPEELDCQQQNSCYIQEISNTTFSVIEGFNSSQNYPVFLSSKLKPEEYYLPD